MNDELELKYAVEDLAGLEAFLDGEFPIASSEGRWRTRKVTDRYFDTADGAFAQAGFGARLRHAGGRTTVGLKSDVGLSEGVHHRRELEADAMPTLKPGAWPPSEVRTLVRRLAADGPLRERFALRQTRRERVWRADHGSCVFSLDVVSVRKGSRQLALLQQLEVELRDGDVGLLHEIGSRLDATRLVARESRSKMALAAELVEIAAPLRADEPFAEAGRRVLRRHLQRMVERERAARTGDPLALKQMRVASRRMRATWRLFDGAYRRRPQQRYVRELRRVARRLGAVRDMDVLLESLPEDPRLAPLAEAWRDRRQAAWQKLLGTLDSDGYASFLRDYGEFTRTPGLAGSRLGRLRVRDLAGSRLWSAFERLRAYETQLDGPDMPTLHALRIDGKRLRYALETFADVLPRGDAAELIARLTRMQDLLGALNDADVAAREASAWLGGQPDASASSRRAVRAHIRGRRSEVEILRVSFGRTWRAVSGPAFRRSLGRAIADLG